MDTASAAGLIKTIVYIIVGYYVIKFLARLLFPVVVRKVVSKAEESFKQQYQANQHQYNYNTKQQTSKDEIIIDSARSNNPKSTKKVGEYVDYEEIE